MHSATVVSTCVFVVLMGLDTFQVVIASSSSDSTALSDKSLSRRIGPVEYYPATHFGGYPGFVAGFGKGFYGPPVHGGYHHGDHFPGVYNAGPALALGPHHGGHHYGAGTHYGGHLDHHAGGHHVGKHVGHAAYVPHHGYAHHGHAGKAYGYAYPGIYG